MVGLTVGLSWILILSPFQVRGQEGAGKPIEPMRQELIEKEKRLKGEEERIRNIEKEVEAKIQKLNHLLTQIEESLKKQAEVRSERIAHLVKTFEAMPPEEAAQRLSSLDKTLAAQIIFKMNNKKAGAILAVMEPKKVAELTEGFLKTEKKIPTP
jgi:flagellar motility protein MotE (MotC chaperone)